MVEDNKYKSLWFELKNTLLAQSANPEVNSLSQSLFYAVARLMTDLENDKHDHIEETTQ